MEDIFVRLKQKHPGKFTDFKLKCWAQMLVSAIKTQNTLHQGPRSTLLRGPCTHSILCKIPVFFIVCRLTVVTIARKNHPEAAFFRGRTSSTKTSAPVQSITSSSTSTQGIASAQGHDIDKQVLYYGSTFCTVSIFCVRVIVSPFVLF